MVNELGGADILQFVPATLRSVECRPASFYIDTPGFSVPSRPDHSLHRHDCRSTVSTCARAVCYSSPEATRAATRGLPLLKTSKGATLVSTTPGNQGKIG